MTKPTSPEQRDDKSLPLDALLAELESCRTHGQSIVFTNGCFDIVHAGHVRYLRSASREGDLLIVGLNSDASVERIKGQGRPIYEIADRIEILSAFAFIDYLVVFETDSVEPIVQAIRPDVLVKGGDYTSDDDVVGGAYVNSYGGRVARLDLMVGRSTTDTLAKLEQPDNPIQ